MHDGTEGEVGTVADQSQHVILADVEEVSGFIGADGV